MANDKSFKIKNGLSATRYLGTNGTETAGSNGPYGTFDTTTYSGTGATQTITNNVDLSTDGGLVWIKDRNLAKWHKLYDTERGATKALFSNETDAENTNSTTLTSFNSNGFTLGTGGAGNNSSVNESSGTYVAWTFKKASNFFDVVTYTGNGATQNVSHSLGSDVGMLIIKSTSAGNWFVWHRSLGDDAYLFLNGTNAEQNPGFDWIDVTSTTISLQNNSSNTNGETFVAYLFAHDTSADGYIQCGSYTGDGSDTNREINVGFKPSWLMIKNTTSGYNWIIIDSVRGEGEDPPTANVLAANTSSAEDPAGDRLFFSDNGFTLSTSSFDYNKSGDNFVYMAIRAVVPTQTLDLSTGHTFSITPTEALDVSFSNPPASGVATGFTVEVNNSAGGYALTWPSSVKWHLGTAPTATASKEVYTFITTDGGTTYYGKKAGENLA